VPTENVTMKGIKENFISKITYSAKKSTGLSLVLKLGTELCKKNPATNPEDKLVIGAGHPDDKNSRLVKYSLTYEENDILLNRSRDILFELFLTEIIQHWFTFLLEIYENALLENLRGGNKYPIKVSRLTLDLSKERDELIENIHENACRNFDFIKADEKLKTVKNLLNVNLVQIENDIKILKSNIKIRNILQHTGFLTLRAKNQYSLPLYHLTYALNF